MATAFISSLAHGTPYGSSLFGYPSYWDVTLTGSDYFSGTYDAWCVNPTQFLSTSNTGYVELYPTYLPSSGYTQPNSLIPGSVFSGSNYSAATAIGQLDNVNWLLNQHFTNNPQFSVSEVQIAIWRLLGFSTGTQYLQSADWQEADVQTLVNQASSAAADSFVPGDDDVFAVIAAPTFNVSGGPAQPIIIETRFAKLGDRVWLDANANGVQDSGEAGVAGVTVQLSGTDAFGQAVTRTTTTASDNPATTGIDEAGSYLFSRLVPGTYTVTFVLPSGYSFTTQLNPGNADGIANDSDANTSSGVASPVILSSGEIERDVDAGIYAPAAIGDRVWLDANANGQQDAGEAGVAGVSVQLYTCVNNAPGALVASTTTDLNGLYGFSGLKPGDYIVKFITPAGYSLSPVNIGADVTDSDAALGGFTACYTLASGETNTTVDAGLYQGAAIGDRVWLDTNANGQQDAGEAGVANVTVELYACANGAAVGPALATTTTNSNGNYAFLGLMPGQYVVKFITPTGYSLSPVDVGPDGTDSDAALSGFTGCYTLASGETNTTADAGLYQPAAIGDRVWQDTNANGQQDAGEGGIPGATVRLYTCVNNAPGTLVAQTTTDANGNYAFTNLTPGDYIVQFVTPNGMVQTSANVGADASDSDAGASGLTGCYTLPSGTTNNTVDAGFYAPAALGDRVWLDANANGQQDAGEAGVAGVSVQLYTCVNNAPGALVASTTTDANGLYGFSGLKPGDYIVKFITPAGYSLSPVNIGADVTDSDAALGGFTACYTLASGETNTTVDAGLYQGAAIGDRVWQDTNANGQQDAGENGIPGATVRLYTCVNNAPGVLIAQTTTDANGNYAFTNLTPGDYIVQFVTPSGMVQTSANVGADASDSDAGASGLTGCYTLPSGTTNNTVDAGFYAPAAIGDRVWLDANANGQQDAGEAGVGGVAVELYTCVNNAPGVLVASTATDANGLYGFSGLKPGDYIVKFITPAGYSLSPVNIGADATDSDAALGGFTACYNLESGETDNTVDAGLFLPTPGIEIIKDAGQAIVSPNTPVTFNYSVKNTGGVPLSNIVVTDDNATPDFTEDDFNPTAVLGANGKNIGDLDGDGLLDITEIWKYSASVIPAVQMTITPTAGGPTYDAGTLTYETLANGDIRVYYRQNNNFNDNTYGTGSDIGWTSQGKTHKFGDLTGSDKAGFEVRATDGTVLFKFYQDYITSSTTNIDGYTSYSGYQSLGFSGGDGSLVTGGTLNAQAATLLKDFDSTLELNLNQAGVANNGIAYTAMTVNSPVGDAGWDVVNGYYFTISAAAFTGGKTFGGVTIFDQHNSPAKTGGSNSYIPTVVGGTSINTALVTGTDGSTTVTSSDDAAVQVVTGPLGALGDRVWLDLDADGVQDAGESGISGVKLTLLGDFDQNGTIDYTATTTTSANGIYMFNGLPAGEYKVVVDAASLPANLIQTYDLDGLGTVNMAVGELSQGQTRTDFDFGYVPTAPGFSLLKTANKTTAAFGEQITYTYEVRNTGSQALSNVVLKDDNATPGDPSDDFRPTYVSGDDGDGLLETGEVWKYSATVTPPISLSGTVNGQTVNAGMLSWQTLANGDIRVTYLQNTGVNDNTYGAGAAADWPNGHKFGDLTGSDKAGFELKDANGVTVMKFYMDYITSSTTQEQIGGANEYANYSGYRSLGVTGGDGSISVGSAANLYDFDSTLEVNLNRSGYTTKIVDSPVGDPNWNVVNGYSFTVKASAFGATGFGGASIFDQHNSPSKLGVNSFVPTATGGEVTNTALVTATLNGSTVVAIDDATVIVGAGPAAAPKFFVVDIGTDDTFKYAANGAAVGNFALQAGNTDPRDIAANADGSMLWVLDKDKNVNVYKPDGTAVGLWKADGLGTEPEGITLDGSDLWMADRARKIYWYDNAASNTTGTDTPEKTFAPAMSGNLKGIVTDGTHLWAVTEGGTDYVYRFTINRDASGNPTGLTQDGQWSLATANSKPTGITLDPTNASNSLWVVDESSDSVYEYAGGRNLTSGSATAANTFKLEGTNLAAQGIADPLSFSPSHDATVAANDWWLDASAAIVSNDHWGADYTAPLDSSAADLAALVGCFTTHVGESLLAHA